MAANAVPKSRITLTYKMKEGGKKRTINLPLRLLLLGDLSKGRSKDCAEDLDAREIRNLDGHNLSQVMDAMGLSVDLSGVENQIKGDGSMLGGKLPITGLNSFQPAEVAKNVEALQSMLLLKEVLEEVHARIDNQKPFRNLIRDFNKQADKKGVVEQILKDLGAAASESSFDLTDASEGSTEGDDA